MNKPTNPLEKPMSMPLKEFLIKKLSLKLVIPETIIKQVIDDQFSEATKATAKHNSIELAGFGRFIFNQKKAEKRMVDYQRLKKHYEDILSSNETTPELMKNTQARMITLNKSIEHLTPKLHTNESNTKTESDI